MPREIEKERKTSQLRNLSEEIDCSNIPVHEISLSLHTLKSTRKNNKKISLMGISSSFFLPLSHTKKKSLKHNKRKRSSKGRRTHNPSLRYIHSRSLSVSLTTARPIFSFFFFVVVEYRSYPKDSR